MIRLRVQEKACSEMTQLFEGSYSLPAAVPVIVGVTGHGGHGGDSRERSQEAMRLLTGIQQHEGPRMGPSQVADEGREGEQTKRESGSDWLTPCWGFEL